MRIPPKYRMTNEILELIVKINALKLSFDSFKIPPSLKINLDRKSLLKSALYSAKIEGNPLDLSTIDLHSRDRYNIEIFNILSAYEYVNKNLPNKIDIGFIKVLHKIVMKNLSDEAGFLRTEMNAIFNQAGVAVFVPPSPKEAKLLLGQAVSFINDCNEFSLINAFLFHLLFEKIHPFMDGNGRVGRLLIFSILRLKKYGINIFPAFEEELEKQRSSYYFNLNQGLKKTEDYLIFMLSSFYSGLEKVRNEILSLRGKYKDISYLSLFPRQQEILNIIRDHKIVSFDFIRRRFLKVPPRTLRYDLKVLREKGFIIKMGKTRGVLYKAIVDI